MADDAAVAVATVVAVRKGSGKKGRVETWGVARAKPGEKPGVTVTGSVAAPLAGISLV